MNPIDQLLAQINEIRASDMPGNRKASAIFSVKCKLRKLGWQPDQAATATENWHCPKCDNRVVAHVPMIAVACNRHTGGQVRMIRK